MIEKATIEGIIRALGAGCVPAVDPEDIPCFSKAALAGDPVLREEQLAEVMENLTAADIPTFERALAALDADEQAWLGFKIVTDPGACLTPVDPDAAPDSLDGPSADGTSTVFVATEGGEIVCSRPVNGRDRFQMLDITRGPSMHKDQFAGLTWASVALFDAKRVVIYGAGEVSLHLARYAHDCGFATLVVDDDAGFLSPERFPESERVQVRPDWGDLADKVSLTKDDYCVCVSRGHLHDPETLAFSVQSPAAYVGMMGHPEKNQGVYDALTARGIAPEALERVHAPIGIKIADKTPAEIAISIIAELIDVRGKARAAHERSHA